MFKSLLLQYDWYDLLKPYLEASGVTKVGVVGNCWGSYFVEHVSAADSFVRAGFSTHPSHPGAMDGFGESEEAIYGQVRDNGAAQYFGNTPQEGDTTRPGGLADQTLDVVSSN